MEESIDGGYMEDNNSETVSRYQYFKEVLDIKNVNPKNYSPLSLAYIGDSIFDVMIRTMEVSRVNMQANKYHKHVSKIVCAPAQAKMILAIEDKLTEEEQDIFRRGRNAKSNTKAKNASTIDYRNATGYEALLGYLSLTGNAQRLDELFDLVISAIEEE